jgi:formate dehydrogenase maturation protein FdhE
MEQKRKMRFSDKELQIIKNTFNDETILFTLRKVFLQLPLNDLDERNIRKIRENVDIASVIRRTFLPVIEADSPIQQVIDLWMTIEIKDKDPFSIQNNILSRELLIKYLEQQLAFIENGAGSTDFISFDSLSEIDKDDIEKTTINLITRNTVINHTETMLFQLFALSNYKEEMPEEIKEREEKDSAR